MPIMVSTPRLACVCSLGRGERWGFAIAMLAAAASMSCESREARTPEESDGGALVANVATPPPARGDVTQIASRADVRLSGERLEAKPGDWLIRGDGVVAVISAAKGRVIDFGIEGELDELSYFDPVAYAALEPIGFETARVEAVAAGVVRARRKLAGMPVEHHAFYWLDGPRIVVEAVVAALDQRGAVAIALGEVASWGNVPTFASGHGFVTEAGSVASPFFARGSRGIAYATCSEGGRQVARFSSPALGGYFSSPKIADPPERLPGGSISRVRRSYLAVARGGVGDAALELPCVARGGLQRHELSVDALPDNAVLEVDACGEASEGSAVEAVADPRFLFPLNRPRPSVHLPQGCYLARITAPGCAKGARIPIEAFAKSPLPPEAKPQAGRLAVRVRERAPAAPQSAEGEKTSALPSKLVFKGVAGTNDPDFGMEPGSSASQNFVYTRGDSAITLPPGRYRVGVTRGLEYDLVERDVTINADAEARLDVSLERVVDTIGYIASDLHVHAIPSSDAPTALTDRVRSLAAVGVEVAVATDHDAVTDYAPAIQATGLEEHLASIVGDEVTTRETLLGHYNVFPVTPGEPIASTDVTPADVFRASRARGTPGLPFVVQVNHPRMGDIGYLELLRFDAGDPAGWARRASLADLGFDALEVFNGDHYADIDKVERCMNDWFALLDAGYKFVATGNSDSHRLAFHEAGVPRTYVELSEDAPKRFDAATFLRSLRSGRAIVTSGPFVVLSAARAGGPGSRVPLDASGEIDLRVVVRAAPWVDVAKVEIFRRRSVVKTFELKSQPSASRATDRLDEIVRVSAKRGDWLVARVRGEQPMPLLYRSGAKPFAFTNPIWVE